MTPNRKAQIATAVLMMALGLGVFWKQRAARTGTSPAPQPQEPIYQALDAVREGSFTKYIDAHTGQVKDALLRAAAESGKERLLQSLKEQNAPLKGIAILESERLSDREMKAKVEYVFADRSEVQTYYLQKAGSTWKIARVDGAQRIQTLIPYGTPVN
jgi:hypothetical protein